VSCDGDEEFGKPLVVIRRVMGCLLPSNPQRLSRPLNSASLANPHRFSKA
jgi:hypothetical protein